MKIINQKYMMATRTRPSIFKLSAVQRQTLQDMLSDWETHMADLEFRPSAIERKVIRIVMGNE